MAEMIAGDKRNEQRRALAKVEAEALAAVKVEDAAHLMAVRMLAGKA